MIKKWLTRNKKFISSSVVFKHHIFQRESQESGKVGNFDVIECLNWVNIIAIDQQDNIILVKQYRHGTDEVTLEIPGGAVDPGEDFLAAAKRELEEETGYCSQSWKYLGEVHPNPAFMSNSCQTFLALDCQKNSDQNLDPLEEVEVELFDKNDIDELIGDGKITHSLVIAAFFFYMQNNNQ